MANRDGDQEPGPWSQERMEKTEQLIKEMEAARSDIPPWTRELWEEAQDTLKALYEYMNPQLLKPLEVSQDFKWTPSAASNAMSAQSKEPYCEEHHRIKQLPTT